MKLQIFAIRDFKAEAYNTPFFFTTQGQALRAFQDLVTDKQSTVSMHPEDFSIYLVGTFDTDSANITPHENGPQHMAKATDLADINPTPLHKVS